MPILIPIEQFLLYYVAPTVVFLSLLEAVVLSLRSHSQLAGIGGVDV